MTQKQASPKRIIREYMQRMSQKAAAARREKITPERRRQIALHAAQVRWMKYRAAAEEAVAQSQRGEEGQEGRG